MSNDYTNPNTNLMTPTMITLTLTDPYDAFGSFCAPVFFDFIRSDSHVVIIMIIGCIKLQLIASVSKLFFSFLNKSFHFVDKDRIAIWGWVSKQIIDLATLFN